MKEEKEEERYEGGEGGREKGREGVRGEGEGSRMRGMLLRITLEA